MGIWQANWNNYFPLFCYLDLSVGVKELTRRQTASLSTDFLDQFGISRGIKLRSLTLLEKASLIQLSKASGKSLKITLFPYPTKQNSMDPYHRGVITEPQFLFFLPPLIDFYCRLYILFVICLLNDSTNSNDLLKKHNLVQIFQKEEAPN